MATEIAKREILTYELQAQLLGGWLKGEGTEYIKYFKASDFKDEELFKAIKSGKLAIDIPRLNIGYTMADLAKFIDGYVELFFRQALERATKLQLSDRASHLLNEFVTDQDLAKLQQQIEDIRRFGRVPQPEKNLLEGMQADMEYRKNEKAVKYGLPYLDKLTRGIHRKELTTVAARPGVGKSSFALQVATRTAIKHEEKVLYFSLEMPAEQQMYRLLLMTEKATKEEIDDYYINPEAENFVKRIEQSKLLNIYESVNQLSEICGAIRSEKPYLVILDQLTQIRVGGRSWKSRLEELQEITATLKKVSMEENVAIMLLCQINRDAANSEPTLANLKGSGQIEEDSDNVILLHNLEKNDSIEPKALKKIQLKLEKQRSGATSSYTVMFNPKKYRFYELSND